MPDLIERAYDINLGSRSGTAVENSQLSGHVLLVVEDEPLVELDIAEMFTASGAHVVSACKIADAILAVDRIKVCVAVLDIDLGGEDCSPVCRHLSERGIPFLFYTGYPAAPDGWTEVPIISKPAHRSQIVDAVERLCRSHQQAA